MGEKVIPKTAKILTRDRAACLPSCKCRACNSEIVYAHPGAKLTVQIGDREFPANICTKCNRMNDLWVIDAMRHVSLHKQGLCMSDRFDNAMARVKCLDGNE